MYNQNSIFYEPYQGYIRGNMFKNLYDNYNNIYDINPVNEQAKLLTYLNMFDFACIDLELLLDNFPNNTNYLKLYNELNNEKNNIQNKYEELYGPLTINSNIQNSNQWLWSTTSWPWEV